MPTELIKEFSYYLKPKATYLILSKDWVPFTVLGLFLWVYHIAFAVFAVDRYCNWERLIVCGDAKTMAESTKVYDVALMLAAWFHIIEWIRQTLFLTTALVNVNLVWPYYVFSINVVFGLIALLVAFLIGFTSDAEC